ncbi:MAG TPA: CRISPR-associated helicase Cas3' [bacterium]|nr:CRISPR-associated helicase Cas3' [bacterium]
MNFDRMLAKSAVDTATNESSLLQNHLEAVTIAGNSIVRTAGHRILENLSLDVNDWMKRLEVAIKLSCRIHDIGKANESFQAMVRGKGQSGQQPVRHELVSCYLIMNNDVVVEWLNNNLSDLFVEDQEHIWNVIFSAVAGHHTKMDYPWEKAAPALKHGGFGLSLKIHTSHPDFLSIFSATDKFAAATELSLVDSSENSIFDWQNVFALKNRKWKQFLSEHPDWRRFAAAAKALLMAADAAGSSMLPANIPISKWIENALADCLLADDLQQVIDERLGGMTPRPFQINVGDSKAKVTLVEAGCGSGKTIGAYIWAKRHAAGKKLFFCYPTTGTATEGYLGYIAQSPIEAELIHSRSVVDLEDFAQSGEEDYFEKPVRIESLKAWDARIVICTIDTVLSLVRNNHRGLYSSPALLSSAFVFDEVHSLDYRMFEALASFMKALPNASFLLMSASIVSAQKQLIEASFPDIAMISAPADIESLPRYTIENKIDPDAAFNIAVEYVRAGKKVLRVANTVAEAQRWYDMSAMNTLRTIVYHSRFKYIDRKRQHRSMMETFEDESGVLAIATQVAEMSLDLDADLLITDIAPASALIQRLGRLNRRITPDAPGSPRIAVVLPVEKAAPYQNEELEAAQDWISRLISLDRAVSQSDLSVALTEIAAQSEPVDSFRTENVEWLDSAYFSFPGNVRSTGISVPVIMEEDIPVCRNSRIELEKHTIPMNYTSFMDKWNVYKNRWIAPSGAIEYNPERGAKWRK